jgi:hypothetical protein
VSVALVVEILGDASKLAGELDKSKGTVDGWAGGIGGAAVKVAAIAGVAGVAAGAIISMTEAAAADRAEQEKLEAAIAASGAATGDWKTVTDAAIATAQDKAFTDSEARDAMQSLVTATGDVTEASTLMATAQDVARFANVDLATAADAVAKANAGSDGALRKLIPGLEKGATATDTIAAASKAAAGQADLYANSAEGMREKGGNAFGELSETIGSVFLPILDAILPALTPLLQAFGELVSALLPALTPLIGLLAKALGFVATALSTVIGWLVKLVTWLSNAMAKVGDFLASINPFKDIHLPSLPFLNATAAGAGVAAGTFAGPSQLAGGSGGGITINVYGDPGMIQATVLRALRTYDRRNATGLAGGR